jgi:hypothetical protein
MNGKAPEPMFERWRLVQNRFAWSLIAVGLALWPIAVAIPRKLAGAAQTPSALEMFGIFCLAVAAIFWLGMLIVALYRRYWRYAASLLTALLVFFVTGSVVGFHP